MKMLVTKMKYRILSLAVAMTLVQSVFAASLKTDRAWYLAGEAMTVSVTAADALIAYAELCDTNGLAAGAVIGMSGGEGTGVVELPPTLHSGYYVLSVYTRQDTRVSQQLVAVVNPLHRSMDDDIEWVEVASPDGSSYPQAVGEARLVSEKEGGLPETEGHIIKARVRNVNDDHLLNASMIRPSLSIVGKQIHYFEGQMVNNSTAVFNTFGIHGRLPMVLSALTSTDVSLPVEMISPFAALLPNKLPRLVFHYKRAEVEARSLDMQRRQMAITPAKSEPQLGDRSDETDEDVVPLDYDELLFGNKPDLSYNLDEYRQFLTIREVLLEYVVSVVKRKFNDSTRLYILGDQERYNNLLPSLVLIDGMPVYDTEQLLDYDARRIHYINIYDGQYTFGHGIYNGVLSFVTRSGRLTNYPIGRNAQYLVYSFPD